MKAKETKEKQFKKMTPLKWVTVILCGILALILLVLFAARLYFRLPVSDYYRASEKAFKIPGLSEGFIPQGLDYDERTDLFWVTGYMKDGSASPIYLVKRADGTIEKTVYLAQADGSVYNGHAGGIAVGWDYAYVAGGADACMYAYSCDEIMTTEDGSAVLAKGSISTKAEGGDELRVSCVMMDERYLYAVEFYREPSSSTPENHKLTTPAGDYHQALAVAYELQFGDDAVCGVLPTPVFAMSLPDLVQGMHRGDSRIYLSASYGTAFSYVYAYELSQVMAVEGEIQFLDVTMPLYYLDSSSMVGKYKLPPMAEEIVMVDGRLYTMCESASGKYLFGRLTSAQWCYATDLSDMTNRIE